MLLLFVDHLVIVVRSPGVQGVVETTLYGTTGVALVAGWLWLGRSDLDEDLKPRVGLTTLAGAALLGAITFVIALAGGAPFDHVFVDRVVLPFGIGGLFGFPFGVTHAQSISTARAATAAEVSRAHAEAERERFDYLNHLLRHDVLNAMTVVIALTELLEIDEPDPERRARLADIRRRSKSVADFITRMRTLVEATNPETPLAPVDLVDVVREETTTVRASHPAATIEIDAPDSAFVHANELLSSVVGNLVENAVEHNDTDEPTVRVSVTSEGGATRLRIADDGPGIPDAEKATVFEATGRGDHGVGMYLTRSLVERYGGDVAVADNYPRGAIVDVTLRTVRPAPDDFHDRDADRTSDDRAADRTSDERTRRHLDR